MHCWTSTLYDHNICSYAGSDLGAAMEPTFELCPTVAVRDFNKCLKSDLMLEVTEVEGVQLAKLSAWDPQFRKWIAGKVRHQAALSAIILQVEEEIVKHSLLHLGSSSAEVNAMSRWFMKKFQDKCYDTIAGLTTKLISIELDGHAFQAMIQPFPKGCIQIECSPQLFTFLWKQHQLSVNLNLMPEPDAKKLKIDHDDHGGDNGMFDQYLVGPSIQGDAEPDGFEAGPNVPEAEPDGLE